MTGQADNEDASGARWHGLPRTLEQNRARKLASYLAALWDAQSGVRPASDDTAALAVWFDPLARGVRLRADLAKLPPARDRPTGVETNQPPLEAPFVIDAGEGRVLVSPEGWALMRLLHRLLQQAPRESATVHLSWSMTDAVDNELYVLYREWSRQRLDSVLSLRRGAAAPMLPAAVGQVLLLLLNGNVGAEHALRRPGEATGLREINDALAQITGAFVAALENSEAEPTRGSGRTRPSRRRGHEAYSLYGGYGLTEARRRLGDDLSADPVYLAAGSRQRVVNRLARELARREDINDLRVATAVDQLVSAYVEHRPVLASYGLARGMPGAGADLRDALLAAFRIERSRSRTAEGRVDD